VTSPRDEVDEWLSSEVTPLSPPPGSLDRIRRRARQRKQRQVVLGAVGCALVIGAAAAVPQLLPGPAGHSGPPAVAGSQQPLTVQPSASSPGSTQSSSPLDGRATQEHQRTHLSTTTSGTNPPPNFRPSSVTFVGTGTGAVVGAVIGQAGFAGDCATADCTSLAGTSDYGASWYGVSAPVAPGMSSPDGVSQLRFTTLKDGWAFGPALYETSDGGWPWRQEKTDGQDVIDVEAAGQSALAIFASCPGATSIYAYSCTSFALYSSTAGSQTWTPVTAPAGYEQLSDGKPSAAALVISGGTTGYLLTPSGMVLTGPVSGGTWTVAGQAPCQPAGAWANGTPTGAQLAAGPDQHLLLSCDTASGVVLHTSTGGKTWQSAGLVPAHGSPTSLATGTSGQIVLTTNAGVYFSENTGKTWKAGRVAGGGVPQGGFSYVGMTDATQGVAIPSDEGIGAIYVTGNGGRTWARSPITG
jgi:hypothetical protein